MAPAQAAVSGFIAPYFSAWLAPDLRAFPDHREPADGSRSGTDCILMMRVLQFE